LATSDPIDVFAAVAVSSTDTYRGRVQGAPAEGVISYAFVKTGNAAGTLKLEVNNLTDSTYDAAVNAAAGATRAAQEAANTTGWMDCDLSPTDTITVPAGTDPFEEPILLTSWGFRRCRLVYTNSAGTGNISAHVVSLY
jgi:hypothetical protein